jgi:hypothetical protein
VRRRHWLIGLLLGLVAGLAVLETGLASLALIVPTLVWSARESALPAGLGGLATGLGASWAGLVGWAMARCVADPGCASPDYSVWVVAGLVVAVVGVGMSAGIWARARRAAIDTHRGA